MRVHVPLRVPLSGARLNHIRALKSAPEFRVYGFYITFAGVSARSLRAPRSALPLPYARVMRARAGRGSGRPSPWGGASLYPVRVLAWLRSRPPPRRVRVCPPPSVCPRRGGRAVGLRALRASRAFSSRPPLAVGGARGGFSLTLRASLAFLPPPRGDGTPLVVWRLSLFSVASL